MIFVIFELTFVQLHCEPFLWLQGNDSLQIASEVNFDLMFETSNLGYPDIHVYVYCLLEQFW